MPNAGASAETPRARINPLTYGVQVAALAAGYALAGRAGLQLDAVSGFATLVWPPTGIALAALLVGGSRLWLGAFIGALITNVWIGAPVGVALGIAAGNTLEALAGTYALRRIPGFRPALDGIRDVMGLLVLAGVLSTMVSATIGVISLSLGGIVSRDQLWYTWRAWWLGDAIGAVLIAPLLLVWWSHPRVALSRERLLEVLALAVMLVVAAIVIFGGASIRTHTTLGRAYVFFPVLIWAAIRFGQRGAVTAMFVVSVIAIWGTVASRGPFVESTLTESLFALQTFMALGAATFLVLGASIEERWQAETRRRQAQEAAERANTAKGQFLAVMSHELRTPLNAISGYAEILALGLADPLSEKQTDAVARIRRNQQHLLVLINQVLDFAKIEAGTTTVDVESLSVREAVDNLEPLIHPQLARRRLTLDRGPVDAELMVLADAARMRQILLNFLTNAIKFTPDDGHVQIGAHRLHGEIEIFVTDTGIGIPADKLEQVFEPFYQVESGPTRRYDGVGLGLAISRDIARKMGCDVRIKSALGEGCRVSLLLPSA